MTADEQAAKGPADRSAARIAELEARLHRLEDERERRDLLAQYSFTADLYRGRPWVDLWTDDGVYDLGTENLPDAYTGRFEGPERLLELITGPGMPRPAAASPLGGRVLDDALILF